MEIKKIAKNSFDFVVNRLIELLGLCVAMLGLLLLISLLSYSPEDPNFIFTEKKEIQNILGFKGSIISDFFFQSIGLISILVSVTIFITGVNVIKNKKTIILIENLFFAILYCLCGSLFFSFYYSESFWLSINGNGGFVGKFLNNKFLFEIINISPKISFYTFIIFILTLFFLSINLNLKKIIILKI